ncbi:MAG: universal stress protein [Blastocatellia bacterium]|nr:universal stress protein [Blastocatellia bacterium]
MVTAKRIPFARIFCPIDLSEASNVSLRYAIALARVYGSELMVCHCLENSQESEPTREGIIQRIDELTTDNILFGTSPLPNWKRVLCEGDPHKILPAEAEKFGADLIVLCSRTHPKVRFWLGSTAEAICRRAPCPVLVTRQPEREWVGLTTNQSDIQKILVGFDFSADAELALQYGVSLAQEYQAELHILSVMPPAEGAQTRDMVEVPPGPKLDLEEFRQRIYQRLPIEVQNWCQPKPVILVGQPHREILDYAEKNRIDLVCMGVREVPFGLKTLFGSNVDQILRHAPCPVMAVRRMKPAQRTVGSA